MKCEDLVKILGTDFFAGVPDSLLSPLCDYLMINYGEDRRHHVIAANEGNAVALAAGYHLATGKVGAVYMQNSGEGNAINPIASLLSEDVYVIPAIFIIGWRGEPGVKDEPQHAMQGKITLPLLETMGIPYAVIAKDTTVEQGQTARKGFAAELEAGRQVAFVIRKGALSYGEKGRYQNNWFLSREKAIELILAHTGKSPVVSTTGKISREIYELREKRGEGHGADFLTVGSMGHASSIALGIALQRPLERIYCLDGDGATLMHLGALAVIGRQAAQNYCHIVLNNEAHESVGGLPTAAQNTDLTAAAMALGYRWAKRAKDEGELMACLREMATVSGPALLEVKCALGARADLGRPTTTPIRNKRAFMAQFA